MSPQTIADLSEKIDHEVDRWEKAHKYTHHMLEDLKTEFAAMKSNFSIFQGNVIPRLNKVDLLAEKQMQEDLLHAKIAGGIKVLIYLVPVVNATLLLVVYLMHKAGML